MNYFYKIAFVAIGFITIRKLFSRLNKSVDIIEDSFGQNHPDIENDSFDEHINNNDNFGSISRLSV